MADIFFNYHPMGGPPKLKVWGYEELTRAQLSGLQQKPTRIVRSKSQVSGSLLLLVFQGIFLTMASRPPRLMRAC
jgi:hypothetical protein